MSFDLLAIVRNSLSLILQKTGTRKRLVRESEPFCKKFKNLWVFHLYFDMRFITQNWNTPWQSGFVIDYFNYFPFLIFVLHWKFHHFELFPSYLHNLRCNGTVLGDDFFEIEERIIQIQHEIAGLKSVKRNSKTAKWSIKLWERILQSR